MFWQRLISSITLIATLSAILMASQGPVGCLIPLILSVLSVQGLREFSMMAECKGLSIQTNTLFASASIYMLGLYLLRGQEPVLRDAFDGAFLFAVLFMLFVIEGYKKQTGNENTSPLSASAAASSSAFKTIAASLVGFIYVPWCLGFAMKILYFFENGRGLPFVIFLFLVSKSTDIFAYIVGKTCGRHKLIDKVSPQKTMEGSVGGLVGACILALISQRFFLPELSTLQAFCFGFTVSIISQLGDLAESLLKRDAGCKDSGSWICGMGGVLDLLDSIFFTAPFLYYLMRFFL